MKDGHWTPDLRNGHFLSHLRFDAFLSAAYGEAVDILEDKLPLSLLLYDMVFDITVSSVARFKQNLLAALVPLPVSIYLVFPFE